MKTLKLVQAISALVIACVASVHAAFAYMRHTEGYEFWIDACMAAMFGFIATINFAPLLKEHNE